MENITLSETELLKLLETAYEEGWYGSKDMGETVAQRLVKDIKAPEYTHSGGPELTKQLIKECEHYHRSSAEQVAGAWRNFSVEISNPYTFADPPVVPIPAFHPPADASAGVGPDAPSVGPDAPSVGPDSVPLSAWHYHEYTAGIDNIQIADADAPAPAHSIDDEFEETEFGIDP